MSFMQFATRAIICRPVTKVCRT